MSNYIKPQVAVVKVARATAMLHLLAARKLPSKDREEVNLALKQIEAIFTKTMGQQLANHILWEEYSKAGGYDE